MTATTKDISDATEKKKVITKKEQRKAIKEAQVEQKKKRQELRKAQREATKNDPQKTENRRTTNRTVPYETIEQEREERSTSSIEYALIINQQLSTLLESFGEMYDKRQKNKVKHDLVTLLVYGIFCFVLQVSSRREANDTLTWPQFEENLRALFPDFKTMPHADTLFRLLRGLGDNVQQIEQALIKLVGKLIRREEVQAISDQQLLPHCH